ncbi:MAG: ethanolamine utilization protein EutH [Ruminococcaceae bacterium]|nr:ethanolamine utilization protein EutH [Oscillospiraceae bacterium]
MKLELFFACFALLGVIDNLFGNRFRLGQAFERGLMTAGPLILSMAGMIVLSPVLAQGISLTLGPVCQALGMDTSVLAGFFPVDAGGATMAYELSEDLKIRAYNGIIVASVLGATICPVVPLSLQMVKKEFHNDVIMGLLCGIASLPVGCIVSGLIIGCPPVALILNSLPMLVISAAICFGLWKKPQLITKLFGIFGKLLMAFVSVGLLLGMLELFAGVQAFDGMAPLSEAFSIIGSISVILAGVFPMLELVSRLLKRPMAWLSRRLEISDSAVLGLVTTLANSIPVFATLEQMDKKGRILNMAFAVSAGYVFGDHLAFVLSYDRAYAFPMVIGKLLGGIAAVILAIAICKRESKPSEKANMSF